MTLVRLRNPALALALTAATLLAACGRAPAAPDAAATARALNAQPADPALGAVYERSCRTCHSQTAAQAPLVGYAPHWAPRLVQGMPTLVAHVRDGFNDMPARGYCNDCSDATYAALIAFMSTSANP